MTFKVVSKVVNRQRDFKTNPVNLNLDIFLTPSCTLLTGVKYLLTRFCSVITIWIIRKKVNGSRGHSSTVKRLVQVKLFHGNVTKRVCANSGKEMKGLNEHDTVKLYDRILTRGSWNTQVDQEEARKGHQQG
ncbi:hypothetical protein Tco_1184405 [Tanacetum coccineum]